MKIFGRLILILVRLSLAAAVLLVASMFTMFAGSAHGAPRFLLPYLLFTQAIPLIAAAISWAVIIFAPENQKAPKRWVRVLMTSVLVYGLGVIGLFLILPRS